MAVRLDKWLQVARVFRTRTQATKSCQAGRVRVNGTVAKPHRGLDLGDVIEVSFRDYGRILEVRELRDRPLPKAEARRVFADLTPPELERQPRHTTPAQAPRRDPGAGRPSKRERRELDRLRNR